MNGSVLLVEDNPDDEKLTLRALRHNKIANPIRIARDGVEALDLLVGEGSEGFALVLLDINLPKVSGLEVLQRMRADPRTEFTPVVILTSSKAESDLMQGYSLGANSFVRKPINFREFVDAVATLGLYWLVLNEPPPGPRP